MDLKRIGSISLAALALTLIIFLIEINFYNETANSKGEINEILLWSFIRGLVISLAVNIANHYRLKQRNK